MISAGRYHAGNAYTYLIVPSNRAGYNIKMYEHDGSTVCECVN
jgi:hypothetical protein